MEKAYHKTQTQRGKHVSRGHRRFARKRCNKRNTTSTGRVPVNGVFGQTVDQNSTNIQSQVVKPIYKERETQVGRTGSSEDNDTAKRLFHEVGPHRRVLLSSHHQQSSKISSFSTRQQTVRISVSPVRSHVGTSGLYQAAETRDVVTPFERTSCGNLLRRSSNSSSESCRTSTPVSNSYDSTHELGFPDQAGKMLVSPNPSRCVPWGLPKFHQHECFSSTREIQSSSIRMPEHFESSSLLSLTVGSLIGATESCHIDRDLERPIVLPCSSASVYNGCDQDGLFQSIQELSTGPEQASIAGTGVVVINSTCTTQSNVINSLTIRHDHMDEFVQKRVGGSLSGSKDRGSMGDGRRKSTYQCTRAESSLSSYPIICKGHEVTAPSHLTLDGQLHCGLLRQQKRRYSLSPTCVSSNRDMEFLPRPQYLDNSEACSRSRECRRRLCISPIPQSHGVDFGQEDLPTYHSALLSSGSGSICVADKQPTPKVHSQVPRSRVDCDGRVPSELEQMDPTHPSSCCSASKDLTEDKERSGNLIVDSSSMERPTLVPSATGTVNRLSYSSADDREDNLSPVRPSDDPSVMANAETSCMAACRSRLQATGLSDEVCKILQSSWRQTTQKRYEGPWKLWSSWCLQRNLDPFSAAVVDVLAFLAEQFNMRGLACRTISVYKACFSQIHNAVEGQQLGNLSIVSRFMKGVFQLKPAVPKTCSTWSVGPVLQYLSSLEPLEKLSIKDLTFKLTMLVALASAARVHEIAALDCGSVIKKTDCWEFVLTSHVKNSRPNHPNRRLYLSRYVNNPSICVLRCLEHYTLRTASHRQYQQLFLSYIRPFKPVGSQTIARWICSVLGLAGVDSAYTAHSTRSSSTSAAVEHGLPIEEVLKAADWASARTFEKHYHKQIGKNNFASTVLTLDS